MKLWTIGLTLGLIVGIYFKVLSFDPLSIALLATLLWTTRISMKRQQDLADFMKKSHNLVTANQKIILENVARVLSEMRKLK